MVPSFYCKACYSGGVSISSDCFGALLQMIPRRKSLTFENSSSAKEDAAITDKTEIDETVMEGEEPHVHHTFFIVFSNAHFTFVPAPT
jgi:hypothetical protein